MGRRTITEKEISLIKAMHTRGMANKDIQFFFNRRDRPVNTGRISTIKSGLYSDSAEIPPASEAELDGFISAFERFERDIGVVARDKDSKTTIVEDARALFKLEKDGSWILESGEHQECECKQDFDPKRITAVIRAIAALANNRGGYIFFGVSNDGYRVQGVGQAFHETDIVHIVDKVKAHLSPTPDITVKGTVDFDGLVVGFLHVARHPSPPVIVYRDGDGITEGEILFRYPGQSSRIKFGDLRAMLDERDRRAQVALADAASRIADVGTGNTLILDTEKSVLETKGHSILIDQELAENLKFIKEGEFDEKLGAPTLKLVGEVLPVTVKGAGRAVVSYAAIFQQDILNKFLEQEKVDQPIQYIYAGLAQSRIWLPIFYFVRMSGRTNMEVADLVRHLKVAQKGKMRILVERLEGSRSPFTKTATQSATKIAVELSEGTIRIPSSIDEVMPFAQGLTAVKETSASLEELLNALRQSRDIAEAADDANAMGAIFKAACRLDELFFAEAKKKSSRA
jgi:hypothetical protein